MLDPCSSFIVLYLHFVALLWCSLKLPVPGSVPALCSSALVFLVLAFPRSLFCNCTLFLCSDVPSSYLFLVPCSYLHFVALLWCSLKLPVPGSFLISALGSSVLLFPQVVCSLFCTRTMKLCPGVPVSCSIPALCSSALVLPQVTCSWFLVRICTW